MDVTVQIPLGHGRCESILAFIGTSVGKLHLAEG
jgi:hypothetical protein